MKTTRVSVLKLILIPALISLAVTALRLIGELQGWSETWFSTATGGLIPTGMSWLIGITWLALPFGAYFGVKLTAAGDGPSRSAQAMEFALVGLDLPPRTSPPSKLDSEPFEVHSKG